MQGVGLVEVWVLLKNGLLLLQFCLFVFFRVGTDPSDRVDAKVSLG